MTSVPVLLTIIATIPAVVTTASLSILALLIATPLYNLALSLKKDTIRQGQRRRQSSSIRPCPNPNCIRCKQYNRIQNSARCRLPQLLRHHHHYDGDGTTQSLDRIAKGVRFEIIHAPLSPSLLSFTALWEWWRNMSTRMLRRIPIGRVPNNNCTSNNKKKEENRSIGSNNTTDVIIGGKQIVLAPAISGQYPTVLLIPGLSVQPIVTALHAKTIYFFAPSPTNNLSSMIATKQRSKSSTSTSTSTSTISTPIHQILLQEYLHSQCHGQWLVNDTTTTTTPSSASASASASASTSASASVSSCWKVLHLINQGRRIQKNLDLCPQTNKILQLLRQMKDDDVLMEGCMFGNVFFSVLYPGTRIEPHCGPCNVRHRLHFALSIPPSPSSLPSPSSNTSSSIEEGPVMKVDKGGNIVVEESDNSDIRSSTSTSTSIDVRWKVGEAFVFDDSLVHEVDYYGDGGGDGGQRYEEATTRVVLVVDLWHPDLKKEEKRLLRDLYPAV